MKESCRRTDFILIQRWILSWSHYEREYPSVCRTPLPSLVVAIKFPCQSLKFRILHTCRCWVWCSDNIHRCFRGRKCMFLIILCTRCSLPPFLFVLLCTLIFHQYCCLLKLPRWIRSGVFFVLTNLLPGIGFSGHTRSQMPAGWRKSPYEQTISSIVSV